MLRYSLRGLFMALLLASLIIAFLGHRWRKQRLLNDAMATLAKHGYLVQSSGTEIIASWDGSPSVPRRLYRLRDRGDLYAPQADPGTDTDEQTE